MDTSNQKQLPIEESVRVEILIIRDRSGATEVQVFSRGQGSAQQTF